MRRGEDDGRALETLVGNSIGHPPLTAPMSLHIIKPSSTRSVTTTTSSKDRSFRRTKEGISAASDLQEYKDQRATLLLLKQQETVRRITGKRETHSKQQLPHRSSRSLRDLPSENNNKNKNKDDDYDTESLLSAVRKVEIPEFVKASPEVSNKKELRKGRRNEPIRERRNERRARPESSSKKKSRSASLPSLSSDGQNTGSNRALSIQLDIDSTIESSSSRWNATTRSIHDIVDNSAWADVGARREGVEGRRKDQKGSNDFDGPLTPRSPRKSSSSNNNNNNNGRPKGLRRRRSTRKAEFDSPSSPSQSLQESLPPPPGVPVTPYSVRKGLAVQSAMSYSDYVMIAAKTPTASNSTGHSYGAGITSAERGPRIPTKLPSTLLKIPFGGKDENSEDGDAKKTKNHTGLQSLGKSVAKSVKKQAKKISKLAGNPSKLVSPKPSFETLANSFSLIDDDEQVQLSSRTLPETSSTRRVTTDVQLDRTAPQLTFDGAVTPLVSPKPKVSSLHSAYARSNPGYANSGFANSPQTIASKSCKSTVRPKTTRRGRRMEYMRQLSLPLHNNNEESSKAPDRNQKFDRKGLARQSSKQSTDTKPPLTSEPQAPIEPDLSLFESLGDFQESLPKESFHSHESTELMLPKEGSSQRKEMTSPDSPYLAMKKAVLSSKSLIGSGSLSAPTTPEGSMRRQISTILSNNKITYRSLPFDSSVSGSESKSPSEEDTCKPRSHNNGTTTTARTRHSYPSEGKLANRNKARRRSSAPGGTIADVSLELKLLLEGNHNNYCNNEPPPPPKKHTKKKERKRTKKRRDSLPKRATTTSMQLTTATTTTC